MNLVSPSEHQLLVFWTQLLVLLAVARALGQLMRRIGQPAVVGELGAGVLLGPSVLGKAAPDALDWLLPADVMQSGMLFAVAWVGVLLLLIETGFETDLALIRRLGRAAALVATGSLLVPLAAGLALAPAVPDVFLGDPDQRVAFVLFLATAVSISSLAVVAKILGELGLLRRNLGQVTLAVGMSNDMAGWILLGVISGVATAGEVDLGPLGLTVVGMAIFLVGSLTVGQRGVDAALRVLRRRDAGVTGYVTVILAIALLAGVVTQWIGVEAVLGAFVAGVVIGRSKVDEPRAREAIGAVTAGVFAPIFFALAGLRVDLALLGEPEVWRWGVVIFGLAVVAKFAGVYTGARVARLPRLEGLALGFGLNARGTLEIVIATIGLSLGVFSESAYTVVMMMAILSSMAAPPLLRVAARAWKGTVEEQERLRREEAMATNVVVGAGRLLLPSRGGPNSIMAAQVLHLAWPEDVEATVLSVSAEGQRPDLTVIEDLFHERPHRVRHVRAENAVAAVVEESALGYGAVGVGAQDATQDGRLLSQFAEDLLAAAHVPIVLVRRGRHLDRPLPGAFARALVPVAGTPASRAAQEIAFGISASIGTEIVLVHVITRPEAEELQTESQIDEGVWFRPGALVTRVVPLLRARDPVAEKVVADASRLAAETDARAVTTIRRGVSTAAEIIAAAEEVEADVVVLGAGIRQLEGRPFLGHTVEHVLADCPVTVVVVATPPPPAG